jgi:predicted outer membrane repeat protein
VVLSGGVGLDYILNAFSVGIAPSAVGINQVIPPGSNLKLCGDITVTYPLSQTNTYIAKPINITGVSAGRGPVISYANKFFTVAATPGDTVYFAGLNFVHTGSALTGNNADGGAFEVQSGKLFVERSTFNGFETTGKGAAIALESTSPLDKAVFNNVAFINNKAAYGAAIYVKDGATGQDAGGQALVNNSLFTDNVATIDGGAIYSPHITDTVDSNIELNHVTIVDNQVPSSGAVLSGSDISVENSIVAQRLVSGPLCKDDVAILDGNLFTDSTCGVTNSHPLATGNTNALVRYAQLKLGHYTPSMNLLPFIAIHPDSVAVDFIPAASDPNTIQDIRGKTRTGAHDAGSYEIVSTDSNSRPTVTQSGFVQSRNDSAGAEYIDAYRFGQLNTYRVDTRNFNVDANGIQHDNIKYTSVTPANCTITDETTLSSISIPNEASAQGFCSIEAFGAPTNGASEFLRYIELRIYYGTAPSSPRSVRVASSETEINVSFQAPLDTGAGITGYQLRVNGPNSFESLTNCNLATLVCNATGLKRLTNYTVTLMVISPSRVTNFDLGPTRTLQQRQPSAVTSFVVKATPKGGITATWKAPAVSGRTSLSSYRVYVYLSSSPKKAVKVATAKLSKRVAVFKGLKAKKKYIVKVVTYNAAGYVSVTSKTITVK